MSEHNNKLELLGSAPIPKALMSLGVPIMIGMLINALYNLVDAYFVSGLGKSQMGAISIVFPLGQVVVGLGLMFGNGAASYLSRLLGRGDKDTANKVASTALYSSLRQFYRGHTGRGIGASLAPMPLLIIPGCGMQTRHQQSVCVSYRPFPNHRPLPVQLKASQALRAPQPIWL